MSDKRDIPDNPPTGVAWALPLLALGLGLVACCFIIPASDDNRLLAFERERLKAELAGLERQVALNDEFLGRIHSDRALALRLAARQRTSREEGVAILSPASPTAPGGGGLGNLAMSPFALVAAEPAATPIAPAEARGGRLAAFCRGPRTRLVVLGAGLLCCMLGLLAGGGRASGTGS